MSARIVATGTIVILLGLAVFAWKVWWLELPILPSEPGGLWQVEIQLAIRGRGETGSVQIDLPSTRPGQRVFGEWNTSDDLDLAVREDGERRVALWSGRMEDVHRVETVFSVERFQTADAAVHHDPGRPPREVARRYTLATPRLPANAEEVHEALQQLSLPGPEDRAGRVRSVYAFVRHEIESMPTGGDDAILCLVQRDGSERGRTRLFVTLLRGLGIPARSITGLELGEGRVTPRVWAEVWWGPTWLPVSPTAGFFGELPRDWIALSPGDESLVHSIGVRDVSYSVRALRQRLTADELNAVMMPSNPLLEKLSLYRLSVSTQEALRVLLVMPLAALLISVLRNVIGLPGYGTFMPVLIAVALRGTGLVLGLAMVLALVGVGICGRVLVERLQLLVVPRVSILLCVVVLGVAGFALLGRSLGEHDLYVGILFPIVILTMLVERFSIALVEEGLGEALIRAAGSVVMAVLAYPIFRIPALESVMFGFPELIVCLMGLLVLLGGYTGYRASDWLRFRVLDPPPGGATA